MRTGATVSRTVLACGTAVIAILAAGEVWAADAPSPSDVAPSTTVQEVVVTANKRDEKLHDVAMGVTALGGAKLDDEQNFNFVDYAPLVPGLSIQSYGPGENRLILRGENSGGVGSTAAVYIGESPIGSSNALARGALITSDLDTFDIQRVEVLRGPQGTLYGASTEGGLIKFVLNSPNLTQFEAAGETGLMNVEGGQTAGDFKGMINIPLLNGQAALRLSGYYEGLPGYINDPLLNQQNINAGSKYGLRAGLLYKPTEELSVKITAVSQYLKVDGNPSVDVFGAPYSGGTCPLSGVMPAGCVAPPANQLQPTSGLTQNTYQPQFYKDRIENVSGEVTWNPGPVSVTSVTSYGILNLSTFNDLTATEASPGLSYGYYFSHYVYGGTQTPNEPESNALHKFTEEVRIASAPGQKLEWQVGGFYTQEHTVVKEIINTTSLNGLPPPGGVLLTADYTEWAGFADATYHFLPQFDVEAGLRWSTNSQSAQTITYSGLLTTGGGPTVVPVPYSSKESDVTYSIAPRWHVNENTLIYGRVATGYRPGGPNDLPASVVGAPASYGSDSTFNYEVGLRSSLLDGKLSVDVAAFHIDWKNIQILELVVLSGTPTGVDSNAGDASSQGVEWTIGLFPIQGLSLNWTGAYTDAHLTKLKPEVTIDAVPGDRLPYVPAWQTALDAEYRWSLTERYKAFIGGTFAYTGTRYSDYPTFVYLPALYPPYGDRSPGDGYVKLPAYSTMSLRAGVENDHWRFELYGKNLSNVRGITNYSSTGGTYITGAGPTPGGSAGIIQPLTVGAVLSFKY